MPNIKGHCIKRGENSKQMRDARNSIGKIDYATMPIPHLDRIKQALGARLKDYGGAYYLDGKRILLGDLMKMSDV